MAFIVETGAVVSNATSLASVADADDYWTDREGGDSPWLALDTEVKERRLILGSDYLRNSKRYDWTGNRKTYAQRLPFPRTGAYERGSGAVPDNVVPRAVVEAVCYLAFGASSVTSLQPDLARGGAVASESVGDISVSYRPDAPTETVITVVDGLLMNLTSNLRNDPLFPTFVQPSDVSGLFTGFERG